MQVSSYASKVKVLVGQDSVRPILAKAALSSSFNPFTVVDTIMSSPDLEHSDMLRGWQVVALLLVYWNTDASCLFFF